MSTAKAPAAPSDRICEKLKIMHHKRSKKYRPPHPVRKFYHKRPKHRIPFWNEFGLIIITYEQ